MDDVPEGVLVKITLDIIDDIPVYSDADGILSSVYHPQGKEVSKKVVNDRSPVHTVASSKEGIYKIWLETTPQLFSVLSVKEIRVSIKILNEMEIDKKMQNAISKDDLTVSRNSMTEIMSQISEILIEQEYESRKEDIFIDYQTSLNNNVFWLTLIQIGAVIWSAIWIVINLNNFFKKR